MHLLQSAAVQYTNYGTGGAFELPKQSGTYNSYTTGTSVLPDIYAQARAAGPSASAYIQAKHECPWYN